MIGAAYYNYNSGDPNPLDSCQSCQPEHSTTGWTTKADGSSCDVGKICDSGACNDECLIGSTFYPNGALETGYPCESCLPGSLTSGWTQLTNGTFCGAAQVCNNGTCSTGCWINASYYNSDAPKPANSCQTCQPGTSRIDWTPLGDGASCGSGGTCSGGTCVLPGNPSYVQGIGAYMDNDTSIIAEQFSADTGGASASTYLVVFAAWESKSVVCGSPCISDSQNNTWTCLPRQPGAGSFDYAALLCYAPVTGTGGPNTVTLKTASTVPYISIFIHELNHVGGVDGNCAYANGGTVASCSVTTTVANELLFGALLVSDYDFHADTPTFVQLILLDGDLTEYRQVTTAASYPIRFTGDYSDWVVLGLALKPM